MTSFTLKRNDRVVGMGAHSETKSLVGGDTVYGVDEPEDLNIHQHFNIPHTCVKLHPFDPECPRLWVPTEDLTEHD